VVFFVKNFVVVIKLFNPNKIELIYEYL